MEQQENEAQSFQFLQTFGGKDWILVEKFKDIEIIKNFSKLMIFETELTFQLLYKWENGTFFKNPE